MVTKKCSICNIEKNFPVDFTKGKSSCKICRNKKLKEKRLLKRKPKVSKEHRLQKIKEWQKNNPDKRNQAIINYHKKHFIKEKVYRETNKEKILARVKKYRQENRLSLNDKLKIRRKNPIIKLRHQISSHVRLNIRGIKCGSILKFLEYSIQDLKDHLEKQFESWMKWSNWGAYNKATWNDNDRSTWTWQLDHIISQSKLPYSSMTEDNFQKCWTLSNLRPYSAKQNLLDGTMRIR